MAVSNGTHVTCASSACDMSIALFLSVGPRLYISPYAAHVLSFVLFPAPLPAGTKWCHALAVPCSPWPPHTSKQQWLCTSTLLSLLVNFPVRTSICFSLLHFQVVRDSGSNSPSVTVDVDCLMFDRVLLFLEAHLLQKPPPQWSLHLVEDLAKVRLGQCPWADQRFRSCRS